MNNIYRIRYNSIYFTLILLILLFIKSFHNLFYNTITSVTVVIYTRKLNDNHKNNLQISTLLVYFHIISITLNFRDVTGDIYYSVIHNILYSRLFVSI